MFMNQGMLGLFLPLEECVGPFTFTWALNSVFLFWKLLVFEFLLCTSEIFCVVSALQARIVLLLDALHPLMLFVGTFTYLEPKLFLLIVFYNDILLIIKTLT
jgi:hypothetical protein